jgi:hypothetical protein
MSAKKDCDPSSEIERRMGSRVYWAMKDWLGWEASDFR